MISAQDNLRGAVLMMVSMAAFTFNDAFMKMISAKLPLFQILMLRGILTTCLIALVMLAMGRLRFAVPREDSWLVFTRVVAEAASAYFFPDCIVQYANRQCQRDHAGLASGDHTGGGSVLSGACRLATIVCHFCRIFWSYADHSPRGRGFHDLLALYFGGGDRRHNP